MLQNIFQIYLLCKNLLIFWALQNVKNYSLMTDVCSCLSVCLTAYLSFLTFIRRGKIHQNTRG